MSDIKYLNEFPEDFSKDKFHHFLPLDFKDLDTGFGEIPEHKNVNGYLLNETYKYSKKFHIKNGEMICIDDIKTPRKHLLSRIAELYKKLLKLIGDV